MPTAAPPGIGSRLRKARQERHLSIEETAWRTRVRPDLLRAIEREQFGVFESGGFVRGLLGSYARVLGLDPRAIVREYVRHYERGSPSPIEQIERRERESKRPPRPKWLAAAVVSLALLVTAGIVGLVGGDGTAPETTPVAIGSLESRHSEPPAASRAGVRRVTLVVEATGPATLTVTADGEVRFEGALEAGDTRSFVARQGIDLVVGNAGAVRLRVNGVDLGAPGEEGAVYRASFAPGDPVRG